MSAAGDVTFAPRWWRLAVVAVTGTLVVASAAGTAVEAYILHLSAATAGAAALDLIGAAALLARRRWTTAVLAVETVVAVGANVLASSVVHSGTTFVALVALYTFGTRRPREDTIVAAGIVGVTLGTADCVSHGDLAPMLPILTLFAAVTAVTLYVRSQRALMASYRERAELAEREQQWTASRAVAAERVRIARELHDIVAHHVSLLVVQAGAVRETLPGDHVTRPVLDSMIDGGRQAMDEMRDMLVALRFEDGGRPPARAAVSDGAPPRAAASHGAPPSAPQPTADQIPALVSGAKAAGLPVTLRVDGAVVDAPPAASLAAYRIVQEALTNALKHAPGAFTTVHLGYQPDALAISVRNGPPPLLPAPGEHAGRGHGLVGMRERAVLAHGTITVGPTEDGWEVRARLPLVLAPPSVLDPARAGDPPLTPAPAPGPDRVDPDRVGPDRSRTPMELPS